MAPVPSARPHLGSLFAAAAVAGLLLLPGGAFSQLPLESIRFPIDKLVHVVLFLLPAPVWRRSIAALGSARPDFATWTAATLFAGALELAQGFLVPHRSADVLDLVAGSLGAAAGLLLARRRRTVAG